MTAHKYFEQEMSGEPLTQESVEEGLKDYARLVLEHYVREMEEHMDDSISKAYKETVKTMLK